MAQFAAVLICLALPACADADPTVSPGKGAGSTVPVTQAPVEPLESSTTEAPVIVASTADLPAVDSLQLVCDGIRLPGDSTDLQSLPPMDEDGDHALAATTEQLGFDMWVDQEWWILDRSATGMRLISEAGFGDISSGRLFLVASFTRNGDSWNAGNFTTCAARWGAADRLNVDWLGADPGHRTATDSRVLHLVFVDDIRPCGSGDADFVSTVVEESDEAVSIVVLVEPGTESSQPCPAGLTLISVELAEPLGTRSVVDGSTEPPRPLTIFRPEQRLHVALAGRSVLGWWDADSEEWVDTDATSPALPIPPGTKFELATLDGPRPDVRAGPVVRDCEPAQTWRVALDPAIAWGEQTLAVNADWPIEPRFPTTLSTTIPDYDEAVRAYLAEHGLPGVPVLVEQVIRVDLDGDGTEEVLVSARHPDAGTTIGASAGFHSVVLLRRVVGAGVETTALFEDLHPEPDHEFPSMLTGQVMAVGDLNGDGTMEIAITWQYYEGGGVDIIDIATGAPQKVLTTSCGS